MEKPRSFESSSLFRGARAETSPPPHYWELLALEVQRLITRVSDHSRGTKPKGEFGKHCACAHSGRSSRARGRSCLLPSVTCLLCGLFF